MVALEVAQAPELLLQTGADCFLFSRQGNRGHGTEADGEQQRTLVRKMNQPAWEDTWARGADTSSIYKSSLIWKFLIPQHFPVIGNLVLNQDASS